VIVVKIAGVVVILLGVAALIYGGFTYTSQKKAVDMGPIQITHTENHDIPIPPLLGIAGIIAGGAMVYFGGRGNR